MSDARLRELERDLAACPTPAARDRLAAERARRGDGPWLPARRRREPLEDARLFLEMVGRWLTTEERAEAWIAVATHPDGAWGTVEQTDRPGVARLTLSLGDRILSREVRL